MATMSILPSAPPGVRKVANAAARLALSASDGDVVIQLDNETIYSYDSTTVSWLAQSTGGSTIIAVTDTNSVDLTNTAGSVTADLRISSNAADAGFALVANNIESSGVVGLRSQVSATNINALTLTDYAYKPGRAGGQTLIGGTANSETLTLSSTSAGTKGKIIFGTTSAYDQVNDRLGVGTASPAEKLDTTGNLGLPTTSSTVGQIKVNTNRAIHFYGTESTYVGVLASNFTTAMTTSVGIGYSALNASSFGSGNVSIGDSSMLSAQDAVENTVVGHWGLKNLVRGSKNTAIGAYSLSGASYASFNVNAYNVGVGHFAGGTLQTGVQCTLIGALADVSSGALNNATALGHNAIVTTSNTLMLGGTGSQLQNIISGAATTTQKFHIRQDTATYHYYGEAQSNSVNVAMAMRRSRASNANLSNADVVGDFDFIARANSSDVTIATIEGMYTGNGTTQSGDLLFKTGSSGTPATKFRIRQTDMLVSANTARANDTTNTSFLNSGAVPESAAASATDGQSASATFSTDSLMFTVAVGTDRKSMLLFADYTTATITVVADPSAIFLATDAGTGIYVSKSASSAVITIKNRTGNTRAITVQAINSNLSSVTAWA